MSLEVALKTAGRFEGAIFAVLRWKVEVKFNVWWLKLEILACRRFRKLSADRAF